MELQGRAWALVRHLPQGGGPGGDIGCRHSSVYAKTQDFFHIPLPSGCKARIYLVIPLLAWHLFKCVSVVKNPVADAGDSGAVGWEDPLEEEMAAHSVFLPGKFHGQRSLAGYSPWVRRVGHD